MAESEDLVAAVLWVAERVDDPEPPESIPTGLRRTMWNLAAKERKEFFGFLRKALDYRKKEEVVRRGDVEAQELEEAEIERLEGRLGDFMKKDRRVFCEKCWRELVTGEFATARVVVTHDPEMPTIPKGASI